MNHFYDAVPGIFNFQGLYERMVKEAPDSAHFVEIGSFLGKSAAFMAVEIINSKKGIVLDCVDTFKGSPDVEEEKSYVNSVNGDYYTEFLMNVRPVLGIIRPFPIPSLTASCHYEDESLDFVYIDAAHDYYSVRNDINDWLPRVKPGGYIGGHDYSQNCPGVWQAVNKVFGKDNVEKIKTSWLIQI